MKCRKKPVEVEAWPIRDLCRAAERDWSALPQPVVDLYENGGPNGGGVVFARDGMYVPTLEGSMFGGLDDMLIRGVKGEFCPCKREIFEATYEAVSR